MKITAVECTACGHRAIAYEGKVEKLKGDMPELPRHKFVCSLRWRGWLSFDDEETREWHEAG